MMRFSTRTNGTRHALAAVTLCLTAMVGTTPWLRAAYGADQSETPFRSADGKYEASRVGPKDDLHYEIKDVKSGDVIMKTRAEYPTPNVVKAGAFSPDSKSFAAAYHYSHEGGYTWIGVWKLETRALERGERKPGITTDLHTVFRAPRK